jgi:hypothetical protein
MKYIKTVVVFDGDREFENEEVIEHPEFKKYYAAGNTIYHFFIDEINSSKSAYLYIDATARPLFQIKNAPIELIEKMKLSGL